MMETQKKLEQGAKVDPGTLNVLVLSGIINILCQSEEIEETEEKVKILEQENITNKIKIEYLESWVIQQHDLIEDLDKKLARLDKNGVLIKESGDTEHLRKKVVGIEIDVNAMKKSSSKHKEPTQPPLNSKVQVKKCKECDKTFAKNSDLEVHVVAEHGHEKTFGCETCGKLFVLEWRMKKHLAMQKEETTI